MSGRWTFSVLSIGSTPDWSATRSLKLLALVAQDLRQSRCSCLFYYAGLFRPASLLNSRGGLCGLDLPGHPAYLRSWRELFGRPEPWQWLRSLSLASWPTSTGRLADFRAQRLDRRFGVNYMLR